MSQVSNPIYVIIYFFFIPAMVEKNISKDSKDSGKDRGWAWIVTLATFITTALGSGTLKALGVMLPTLRQQFSTQTWVIGLSIALTPGFGAMTCKYLLYRPSRQSYERK